MKVNQLKAGVILSYTSTFLAMAISILYTPVMLRLLGQSEYGLYQLVASVVSYLSLFTFGFGSAYVRYFSRYKVDNQTEKIAQLNGMFLTIFSVIGLIALICGGILSTQVETIFENGLTANELAKAKILMRILVVNIALSFPFSVFNSYITANERYVFQQTLAIVKALANPFLVLPLLLMGYQSVGMVVATTVLNITIEVIYMVYALKKIHMQVSFKGFDTSLFKEIAVFSSYIFINLIVDQISWNVDKFLLGIYQSTVAVSIYSIAAQIKRYYTSFADTVCSVFTPRVNRLVASNSDDQAINQLFIKVGRIQFLIMSLILSGLFIFGRAFIILWAGPEYELSYIVLLIMAVPITIPRIQGIGVTVQRAKNLHKFRSWTFLAIAVGNLIISIPLCKLYGAVGCAIGTALAVLLGHGLAMNIYYHKRVGLNMVLFWKEIFLLFKGLVIPILFGILISLMADLNQIVLFLVYGCMYVFVFALSMWMFGLNTSEKNLVLVPLKKILKQK